MPPAKRARHDTATPVESADSRIDALLADVEPGGAASALLIAAMEWDAASSFSSEGRPATDFFTRLKPFVTALGEEDNMAKSIFDEAVAKPDETALEEVHFLSRSGVIDEEQEHELRAAEPEDRRRMLFVALLTDSETPEEEAGDDIDEGNTAGGGDDGQEQAGEEGEEEEEEEEEEEFTDEQRLRGDDDPDARAEQMREGAAAGCRGCRKKNVDHDCPHCGEGGWAGWAECSCPDGFHAGGGEEDDE